MSRGRTVRRDEGTRRTEPCRRRGRTLGLVELDRAGERRRHGRRLRQRLRHAARRLHEDREYAERLSRRATTPRDVATAPRARVAVHRRNAGVDVPASRRTAPAEQPERSTLGVHQAPRQRRVHEARRQLSGPTAIIVSDDNRNATKQPGEPNHAGDPGRCIGLVPVDARRSTGDGRASTPASPTSTPLLGVYTGGSIDNLTESDVERRRPRQCALDPNGSLVDVQGIQVHQLLDRGRRQRQARRGTSRS